MTKISLTRNKKILIALCVISVLCLIYIIGKTPNTPPPTSDIPQPLTLKPTPYSSYSDQKIDKFIFSNNFSSPSVPKSMNIYSTQSTVINLPQIAQGLATNLNLAKSTEAANYWTNQDNSQTISINVPTSSISYSTDNTTLSGQEPGPNPQKAVDAAKAFMVQNFTDAANLKVESENIIFVNITGYESTPVNQKSKYNTIVVPFSETVDNIPVRSDNTSAPSISVTVGPNYQIIEATYKPNSFKVEKVTKTISTISLDEIKKTILAGKGLISYIDSIDPLSPDIQSVTLNTSEIEYRYISSSHQLEPYFSLYGVATSKTNQSNIVIHTPLASN